MFPGLLEYERRIDAAAESLTILAQDRLGGKVGMMIAFHAWGRSLPWHPHVHCLVPGLVVHPDNTIRVLDPKFLVPVCALSRIYRAVFLRKARAALPGVRMPEPPEKRSWVVHCRPCREGPQNVIRYCVPDNPGSPRKRRHSAGSRRPTPPRRLAIPPRIPKLIPESTEIAR